MQVGLRLSMLKYPNVSDWRILHHHQRDLKLTSRTNGLALPVYAICVW